MKYFSIILLSLITIGGYAADKPFNATLSDPAWDGRKIPAGQQCIKFGGKGSTPALKVEQIPVGTNAIVMEFSDRTYSPMDHGGHGKLGYRITGSVSTVMIPAATGQTFELPNDFFLIEAQRAPEWDKAGAYLPPCSGGKGNDYYVTIKAVLEVDGAIRQVLGQTELSIGKY